VTPPLVSVVMPVRDGGAWLAGAVDSILGQTLAELELIVVDDHSQDRAVQQLDRHDSRLRLLANPGCGVSAAMNAGVELARGHFIARMDADDLALPQRLATQVAFLQARPDLALCGACVEIFVEQDGVAAAPAGGNHRYQQWLNGCRSPEAIHQQLFIESPIPNPTATFRRAALEQLGGYADPDWPEDYDLFLRADRCGMRMGKPEPLLLRWREHPGRLTRRDPRYARERFQAAKAHYLARGRLPADRPIVIWGAGPGGRLMHDLLAAEGVGVDAFVDVHPRRIGGSKRGLPVWPAEALEQAPDHFVLAVVGAVGARPRIRSWLQQRERREGADFLFAA